MPAPEASIKEAVRRVWGYDALRPLQAEAIAAGVEGRDCLTVLPTGGGKSLCYQVPPLVTGKATIVVSPLIALMRDQVRGLELSGYKAACMHSGMDYAEVGEARDRLLAGEIDLLLAAPERVLTSQFMMTVGRLADADRLGAIAIDEAHCISQWGHDFRPEYRRLRELRSVAPGVGMQAFTATATPRVREDIIDQLGLVDAEVLVGVFDRPNLTYRVMARRDEVAQAFEAIERAHAADGGGAIVYAMSRRKTEDLAGKLRALGVDAKHYHAGMNPDARHAVEEDFSNERLDVVVATVAFGMGIDRSNVRLVVHATMPKSIEAYQQETGRAGRDGLPAECLLLHSPSDASRWSGLVEASAEEAGADPAATEAQLDLIRRMRRLAASGLCRHKALSEHFGQPYEREGGCGACDVCLGETTPEPDAQRVAQILMSAVARCGQRWGAGHIADVVRGKDGDRVREQRHDELSVFGLLADRSKNEITSFLDQLVAAGALEAAPGRFETLHFGERGMAVMKGDETVPLALPLGVKSKTAERGRRVAAVGAALTDPADKAMFTELKMLRKSIAEENGVPPYVVFNDRTLRELVIRKPRNRGEFLSVHGIGQRKLDAYGERFLEVITAASE